MFGRKKKVSMTKSFMKRVRDSEIYNLSHKDEQKGEPDEYWYQIPFLPRGVTNPSIDQELLLQLPQHLRKIWYRLDLEKLFAEDEEESDIETKANSEVNTLMLSKEKKLQLKAIALGMANEKPTKYHERVGLLPTKE